MSMRKVPLRQCVGCQELKPKRSMLRIVITPQGEIMIDPTGKKAGRGSYICNDHNCFVLAKKRRALDRGLKTQVADEIYEALLRQIESYEVQS